MTGQSSCENGNTARWIPVAMAAIAAVTAVTCAIANANDSNNCADTAANCPNGVASYEFEGGSCGGGDCNVTCS